MKKECSRILNAIEQTPWAITKSGLESIINIANRSYLDKDLSASIRSDRELRENINNESSEVKIINVFGPIFTRADLFAEISGACSLSSLRSQIDDALSDQSIKAIILNFDSPGGAVTGTHELSEYIRSIDKPIVSYVSGSACSAAYWLASATNHIYADKTATIGSVGVVAMWTDDSEAKKKQGLVDYEIVSSQSPKKRLDHRTDEGRDSLQTFIDGLANIFIEDIANNRNVSADHVLANFGQGDVFLADDAIQRSMADEISNLDEVILKLSQSTIFTGDNHMGKAVTNPTANKKNPQLRSEDNQELDENGNPIQKLEEEEEFDENGNPIKKLEEEEEFDENGNPIQKLEEEEEFDENGNPIKKLEEEEEFDENGNPIKKLEVEEPDDTNNEDETSATCQRINQFARSKPNLYRAIMLRGKRQERQRIKGIEDLQYKGHANLIRQAKYGKNPLNAGQVALAVRREETKLRQAAVKNYESDAQIKAPRSIVTQSGDDAQILKGIKEGAIASRQ